MYVSLDYDKVFKLIHKKNKKIKRLIDVNKARQVLVKAQGKRIAQLLKEKEWLIEKLAENYSDLVVPPRGKGTNKEKVILNMQQALKEEVRRYDSKGAPIN